jgi:hypothetical protein
MYGDSLHSAHGKSQPDKLYQTVMSKCRRVPSALGVVGGHQLQGSLDAELHPVRQVGQTPWRDEKDKAQAPLPRWGWGLLDTPFKIMVLSHHGLPWFTIIIVYLCHWLLNIAYKYRLDSFHAITPKIQWVYHHITLEMSWHRVRHRKKVITMLWDQP